MSKATQTEAPLWQTPEGQTYLQEFKDTDPQQFAVIKVGGELIDDETQLLPLAKDIATLGRLGLHPVIVHGGGPQINASLQSHGISTSTIDGRRVTSREAAEIIPHTLTEVRKTLCDAIHAIAGEPIAHSITEDIFTGTLVDPHDFGSVDAVTVDVEPIRLCIQAGVTPIVSCYGKLHGNSEQPININGDKAATAMAGVLAVKKFISLTAVGAVLDQQGQPISNLTHETAQTLCNHGTIQGGMNIKVQQAMELFDHGVHDVVITSPRDLLQELFTAHGAGTIIRDSYAA